MTPEERRTVVRVLTDLTSTSPVPLVPEAPHPNAMLVLRVAVPITTEELRLLAGALNDLDPDGDYTTVFE